MTHPIPQATDRSSAPNFRQRLSLTLGREALAVFALLVLLLLPTRNAHAEELRTWTNQEGRTLEASLVDFDRESVQVRTEGGVIFSIPVLSLSPDDQQYLRDLEPYFQWQSFPGLDVNSPAYQALRTVVIQPGAQLVKPKESLQEADPIGFRIRDFSIMEVVPRSLAVTDEGLVVYTTREGETQSLFAVRRAGKSPTELLKASPGKREGPGTINGFDRTFTATSSGQVYLIGTWTQTLSNSTQYTVRKGLYRLDPETPGSKPEVVMPEVELWENLFVNEDDKHLFPSIQNLQTEILLKVPLSHLDSRYSREGYQPYVACELPFPVRAVLDEDRIIVESPAPERRLLLYNLKKKNLALLGDRSFPSFEVSPNGQVMVFYDETSRSLKQVQFDFATPGA